MSIIENLLPASEQSARDILRIVVSVVKGHDEKHFLSFHAQKEPYKGTIVIGDAFKTIDAALQDLSRKING